MPSLSPPLAALAQPTSREVALAGQWTALGVGAIERQLAAITLPKGTPVVVDGSALTGLDTVGVWLLQKLLEDLRAAGNTVELRAWRPEHARLLDLLVRPTTPLPPLAPEPGTLERIGRGASELAGQSFAFLSFVGESALALTRPSRLRWRPILYNIRSAGFDALPIVGLLSFLLGVVIAYQAANQLRQFGANIFVADLVGLSMLREFAPLMTAIIVAGRSGSAYAAQIGTMSVSEEIDAMRTLGMLPIEVLVLPKILALIVALPLLTFFADILGVGGGMLMAQLQLGVGFEDFLDRFTKAVSVSSYLIGIGKAPVFAGIIACIGCFQGFRTTGGADGVGRQTTRAVVQSIFLVVVADALFSVAFSILKL